MRKTVPLFVLMILITACILPVTTGESPVIDIVMTDMRLGDFPGTVPPDRLKVVAEIKRRTGLNLRFNIVPHEDYPRKIQLMLSSGKRPDLFNTYGLYDPNFPEIIRSKVAIPLDDYLEKHGPNLLKKIPKHVWDSVRVEGKIYAVPEVLLPSPTRRCVYIRKDWLDKLGIGIPRTVKEYLDVFRLFRDHDLNGNGLKDEIPYTGRQHLSWMEVFFGAYGVLPSGWHYRDGSFAPDAVRPEFIKPLGLLRKMYQENLLDREFLLNSGFMWEEKIVNGQVGTWEHIASWLSTWQNRVEARNPGAKVAIIPAPRGPEGHGGTGKYPPFLRTWFISNTAEDPGEIIRLLDWLVTEEGERLVKYGFEGETYTYMDGHIKWDPLEDPNHTWRSVLFSMVNNGKMDWEYEMAKDPVNGARFKEANRILEQEGIPNPGYDFPIPEILMEKEALRIPDGSLFRESVLKIILGKERIDSYKNFIREWLAAGGEEAVFEATAWYKKNRITHD